MIVAALLAVLLRALLAAPVPAPTPEPAPDVTVLKCGEQGTGGGTDRSNVTGCEAS